MICCIIYSAKIVFERKHSSFHVLGQVNAADSEEEALNLLFLGDTNRVVAETPMNDVSTRSHCLFIIWIDACAPSYATEAQNHWCHAQPAV